jgi:hypothetical protein
MKKLVSDDIDYWENEPIIHSHVTSNTVDEFVTVRCNQCDLLVHWGSRCMTAWADTDSGPICLVCLAPIMNWDLPGVATPPDPPYVKRNEIPTHSA